MGVQTTGWRLAGVALAWLGGVALQLQERHLLPVQAYAVAALLAGASFATVWHWRKAFLLGVLGAATLGFAVTGLRATWRLADAMPPSLEGRDLVVHGVIASLPQPGLSGTRFRFRVESAELQSQRVRVPALLALGWYQGAHEDAVSSSPRSELRAGQRWRMTVRLRRPHGSLNPHGFDYELYLFELGVGATGYVRDSPAALRLESGAGFVVERLRQAVRDSIDASVPDRRVAGVLAALAIGDQAAIDREDWDLFRNTGVAHLMSISGLHVTMFAWCAGLAVGALWRRSPRALLAVPLPAAVRWGGLLAALAYAVASGWGVPAQRTLWMLAAVTGLQAVGVVWPSLQVLLVAAVVVTVADPWALMQPGFWLSFVAVGLLMVSRSPTADKPPEDSVRRLRAMLARLARAARGGVRTQVIATLGLTPLTLVFFQQVSLVGLVANLFAIPMVTLLITPLALLGVLVTPLWAAGAALTQALVVVLGDLAALPGAVWGVASAPVWAQLSGLVGSTLLVLPIPWRARLLVLPLILPLLMPPKDLIEQGRFELVALDVGQGTAILVRTREHLLLYDAGPQYSRDSDAGQRVVLPLLRGRGEARIDRLVLSHRDSDHVGGARALLAAMPVHDVMSSLEEAHPLLASARGRTRCEAGQSWTWDGVRFDVLRPFGSDYGKPLKPNALSCVLRVSSQAQSALFTGDIERDQELALVAAQGDGLRSDVLVVPHHGSRTSSTPEFLDAVRPMLAIFQAGYRNRFGHPAADVLARYTERGIVALQSPVCGAWTWPASSGRHGQCLREASQRYWRYAAAPSGPP